VDAPRVSRSALNQNQRDARGKQSSNRLTEKRTLRIGCHWQFFVFEVATGKGAQNVAVDEEGWRQVDRQTGISKGDQGRDSEVNGVEERLKG
jgi:hypothetical protein